MKDDRSNEDLINIVTEHGEGSAHRHIAQLELNRRALEAAGRPTYRWTVVGALAAIAAAIFALIALLK